MNTNPLKLKILLLLILVVMSFVSIFIGDLNSFSFSLPADAKIRDIVFYEIRLPRLLLAILSGATLGLVGAVLQGLLRNPLAEPGIIGVSGGAAFGAVVIIYFNIAAANSLLLPLGGITGAIVSMLLLYVLAGRGGHLYKVILAGIAINALAAALTALALNLAPSPFALSEILFWLMGSVSNRSMLHVWVLLPFVITGTLLLFSCARGLDALTLGEKGAASLGINMTRLRTKVIIGSGIAIGACVSVTGSIGFIGLIVPHILRPYVHYKPGALLFPSAVAGAILLVVADTLVRVIPSSVELKLGVVTALLGVPFFIYLVLSKKHQSALDR
ncbi:Vitamin B12 ABC transporter, permease protein BtuC [hydrothermal vent metagenome]|uniref:Vitamin B12 ABC transporter, permease protein BtuC n=1 Tax=hydrothermal vent metagenome TaxID=652676 RepID=A0A3B0Y5X2_9ZZZZ